MALIEKLVARGVAYQAGDGSVYFSIEKYRGCGCTYGQLQKLNLDELRVGERVAADEYDKESVADFALVESPRAGGWQRVLAESLGRRPARLAHRMFRHEHEGPRRNL